MDRAEHSVWGDSQHLLFRAEPLSSPVTLAALSLWLSASAAKGQAMLRCCRLSRREGCSQSVTEPRGAKGTAAGGGEGRSTGSTHISVSSAPVQQRWPTGQGLPQVPGAKSSDDQGDNYKGPNSDSVPDASLPAYPGSSVNSRPTKVAHTSRTW